MTPRSGSPYKRRLPRPVPPWMNPTDQELYRISTIPLAVLKDLSAVRVLGLARRMICAQYRISGEELTAIWFRGVGGSRRRTTS